MLYSGAAELPFGPGIPTACIVERCLGDRRLRTHVLAGLDHLLPLIINVEKLDHEVLLRAFPQDRPLRDAHALPSDPQQYENLPSSTQVFISDHCESCRVDYICGIDKKNEFYCKTSGSIPGPRDSTTMMNLSGETAAAALQASEQPPSPSCPPQQVTNSGKTDMYMCNALRLFQRVLP
jgi:hypothetical protein